jgi:hypothetical protein
MIEQILLFALVQHSESRVVSGVIVTQRNEAVAGASITLRYSSGQQQAASDQDGAFRFVVPKGAISLRVEGKYIVTLEESFGPEDPTESLRIQIEYFVPPVHEDLVIMASPLDPTIDRRNDEIYARGLFSRDDQLFHTLGAGISAGQHEGAGNRSRYAASDTTWIMGA